jgi:peptidyl-tRNA hydrolase, PTH1 family
VKIVAGLGNPGPEYEATRHNVGWWALDRICHDWGLGPFRREGQTLIAGGVREGEEVLLLKPLSYMNRSGGALRPWLVRDGFDLSSDLLVVVDDAALDVGRVRFRSHGSDGGHNGLASIVAVLGTEAFPRLRIGVGRPPPGEDLVGWVLSPMEREDEGRILELLPDLSGAVDLWIREGIGPVMNRYNR